MSGLPSYFEPETPAPAEAPKKNKKALPSYFTPVHSGVSVEGEPVIGTESGLSDERRREIGSPSPEGEHGGGGVSDFVLGKDLNLKGLNDRMRASLHGVSQGLVDEGLGVLGTVTPPALNKPADELVDRALHPKEYQDSPSWESPLARFVDAKLHPKEYMQPATTGYVDARDEARKQYEPAVRDHPMFELGGALATPGPKIGAFEKLAAPLATALKLSPAAALKLAAAGRAVGQGAVMGLGNSKADLTKGEVGGAARDTSIGGAAGYVGQKLGEGLSPALASIAEKLQPALKETAENSAVKAAGAIQGDLKKIRIPLTGDDGLGRQILDAKTPAGKSLLGFGSSKKAIQQGAESIVDDSGEKVGGILRALDEKSGNAFDWKRASDRLDQAVEEIDPVETQILGKALEDMKKAFAVAEKRGGGFELANKMKTTLYKNIGHWVPDPSIKAELRQKLAGVFNREIEAQLEEKYGKVALEHLQDAATARAGAGEFSRRAATQGASRFEAGAGARALPAGEEVGLAKGAKDTDLLELGSHPVPVEEEFADEAAKKGPNFRVDVSTPPPPRRIGVPVNPENEALARRLGTEALSQFKGAKKSFGLGAQVEGLAEKGHLRELGNRHVSLSDYLTMGAATAAGVGGQAAGHGGIGAGGAIGTMALGLAHKMARERGRAAVAVSADAAQAALAKALPVLQQKGGDRLGNFSRVLAAEIAAHLDAHGGEKDSKSYDTALSPEDEAKFQQWAKKSGRLGDLRDYDLRGAWKDNAKESANGHLPDTFKKPNHPTFSAESRYSTPENPGGKWEEGEGGKWAFTPSAANLKNMSAAELRKYFKEREPDAQLRLP